MTRLLLAGLLLFTALPAAVQSAQIPVGCAAVTALPVHFHGLVETVGPARWQVAGQSVAIDATTEILPVGQHPLPGVWALVTARWYLDGTLVATRIATYAELPAAALPPDHERVDFGGRLVAQIVATAPEQWLVLTASQDGPWLELRTVEVDRLTVPIDEANGPATPGAWLEATAIAPLLPGQPWIARSLRVDFGPQATLAGLIDEIHEGEPARWQVGNACAIVDGDTLVDGRPRLDRYTVAQGVRLGSVAIWARSAAVRYRFEGVLVARHTHVAPAMWVILVTPPAHVDASAPTRVYLAIDAMSRIDPALLSGVLGVQVAVQARAGQNGWLADWVDDPASPWQP